MGRTGNLRRFLAAIARPLVGVALLGAVTSCGSETVEPGEIAGARVPEAVIKAAARAQFEARERLGAAAEGRDQILFGDLHVHTSYSWDGFLFALPLVGGDGTHPPAEACDFARYCSNLDFFALTDHAETLLPDHWQASKQSVRQCNALAGESGDPDLVAFMGFEWSQAGLTPEDHWGHRCVVFPGTADDELPARPISAGANRELYREMRENMAALRWLQPLDWGAYTAYVDYLDAVSSTQPCDSGVDVRDLPIDCEEAAATPRELHAKLDQWGFPALAIPHGTAWGTYTPASTTIDKHLEAAQYDPQRQRLIEIMSGHGNSEAYRSWQDFTVDDADDHHCPEPTADFLPCCWQAGEIMRSRCGDLGPAECEVRVRSARQRAANTYLRPHNVFPDAEPEEWLDCDQCRDCFKPSFSYRPRESIQYAMALSTADGADPGAPRRRFRYGFVASSDGHTARPGTGYKQIERGMMTDAVGNPGFIISSFQKLSRRMDDPRQPAVVPREPIGIRGSDMRVGSFLYPGGLAAVHSRGRGREAIWEALENRRTYGTSGPRILLWFDLIGPDGTTHPMGSEIALDGTPRFEVRAAGSFVQQPGCPDWAKAGLPPDRMGRLCRNECYHPSDRRHLITAIEVVRIRPRQSEDEPVDSLIEDPWKRLACDPDPAGCRVSFDDADFVASGRDALYYVRALQEPTPAINGAPLSTRFDAEGNAISVSPCWGTNPESEAGCPAPVQERAWSSPIFVDRG